MVGICVLGFSIQPISADDLYTRVCPAGKAWIV